MAIPESRPWLALALASAFVSTGALVGQEDAEQPGPSLGGVLPDLLKKRPGWLRGLDLDFKTVANEAGQESIGIRFAYDREIETSADWLMIHPRVVGNFAFDQAVNPEDFVVASLDLTWNWSRGGTLKNELTAPERAEWKKLQMAAIEIEDETELERMLNRPAITNLFTPQITIDLGVAAGFESNQDFTARQSRFGAVAAIDVDLWGTAARYNVFDYPFALLRHLFDEAAHPEVQALGSTFPQVVVGLDYVTPIDGDPRASVGDTSDFVRASAEVSMRSPIANLEDETVFLNTSYRFFRELSAGAAVSQAGLDSYEYGSVSLTTASGLFIRYVSGTLPLSGAGSDSAFEVGWSYKF